MCVSQDPVVAVDNQLPGSRVVLQGLFQKSCWEGHGPPSKESVRRRTPENQEPEWPAGPVGTVSLWWGWREKTRASRALQKHPKAPGGRDSFNPTARQIPVGKDVLLFSPFSPSPFLEGGFRHVPTPFPLLPAVLTST